MTTKKFRAKKIRDTEWAYGYYVVDEEWAKHYIYYDKLVGAFYQLVRNEVEKETVGQSTGLYDNTKWEDLTPKEQEDWLGLYYNQKDSWKGKEIYEGDILSSYPEVPNKIIKFGDTYGLIQSEDGYYGWYLKYVKPIDDLEACHLNSFITDSNKVIGNIYDNPELLGTI